MMVESEVPPTKNKDQQLKIRRPQLLKVICTNGHTLRTVLVEDGGKIKKCTSCLGAITHFITRKGVKVKW